MWGASEGLLGDQFKGWVGEHSNRFGGALEHKGLIQTFIFLRFFYYKIEPHCGERGKAEL